MEAHMKLKQTNKYLFMSEVSKCHPVSYTLISNSEVYLDTHNLYIHAYNMYTHIMHTYALKC